MEYIQFVWFVLWFINCHLQRFWTTTVFPWTGRPSPSHGWQKAYSWVFCWYTEYWQYTIVLVTNMSSTPSTRPHLLNWPKDDEGVL